MIANKEGGAPHGTAAHSFARSTMPRETALAGGHDAALDRTVAATLADGLRTGERCVRPARVQVHRAG